MEEEARKKAEEAQRQYQAEIERKRCEMNTEKKRIEEALNRVRHQRDQLAHENEASAAKERDTKKRQDELAMRVQVTKIKKKFLLKEKFFRAIFFLTSHV